MKNASILDNHFVRIILGTVLILLIPLVWMQFDDEVNWQPNDFVAAGVLLVAAGLVLNLIVTKVRGKNRKLIALGVLTLVFAYIWAELAVGIFTNLGS